MSVCLSFCRYVAPFFQNDWIFFSWNFAYGPLRHCWGGHKHKKFISVTYLREGGDILGYFCPFLWGFLCSSFSWHFLMEFCKYVFGITLLVITHKKTQSMAFSAGGHFGLLLGSFWCMFQYFLRNVQFFLMKFYTDILGIYSLTVNTLFLFFMPCPHGTHSGVCSTISWELLNIFSWNFV